MENIRDKIFVIIFMPIAFIIIIPFVIIRFIIALFWAYFGATIIGFFILALLGYNMEESIMYSGSVGFFVGVYLKIRKELKKEKNMQ
jgi:hypothetical protein